jgi:ubiquinone/menaquinone biosynthesis C-methylase UbiE
MGKLMAHFYDRFMRQSEEACLMRWRRELLEELHGKVLEVGSGTGVTLPLYPDSVNHLVASEPDRHLRAKLSERIGSSPAATVNVSDATVDSLPFPDHSFDFVTCMLVLCSVPDLDRSIAELRRVLVANGRLVFLEHVAAEDRPRRLRWQRRVEPIWKRVSGNCHLTRRTEQAIVDHGFELEQIQRESIRKAMPITRPSIRGFAVKRS